VAANDDDGPTRQSRVEFDMQEGLEYRIAVDGFRYTISSVLKSHQPGRRPRELFRPATGDVVLNWIANDDFATRYPLQGASGRIA